MAKSSKKPEEKPSPLDPAMSGMAAAMAAMSPATMTAWFQIMQEGMRFMTDRLHSDLETQQKMLACKTPADLLEVQSDFYQKAMAQYGEETQRMVELMGKAMTATAEEAKSGHKRGYDDVPV